MGHIFISYSHKDSEYAHKLAETLQDWGFEVWVDVRLDYGSQWPQEIQKQLDDCSAFILIMSPRAFSSEWVQSELNRAKRKGKPVFPLLLDGDEPWLSVESTQFIDVRGGKLPNDEFYRDLRQMMQPTSADQTIKASPPNLQTKNKAKGSLSSGLVIGLAVALGIVCICITGGSLFYLKQKNWAFLPPTVVSVSPQGPTPTETPSPNVEITIQSDVNEPQKENPPAEATTITPTFTKTFTPTITKTFTPTITKTFTPTPSKTPTKAWSAWDKPGGNFVGVPSISSRGANQLGVFVRGANSHLMHISWGSKGWTKWEDLGGELADSPACVAWDSRRVDCFVRGKNDSELWHISWNGKWSGWDKLDGAFLGAPTVASRSANLLDVFVRGYNTHLMHRSWDGRGWSKWEDLGGELADSPSCVSWDAKRIDCFVRGKSDSELWHISWNGKWSNWDKVGGAFVGAPTTASRSTNLLDVFVLGTNSHLMHRSWDGRGWSKWEDLGGELADSPGCISWDAKRIDCFIRGKGDSELWHIYWSGN